MSDHLKDLVDLNFMEYASYVIKERAIPHIDDGFKPVQRRILHTMYEMEDGKFNKVANVVGRSMQYHPHGDASIYSALVNVANKDFFIDKQGNFGNVYTGDSASAPRYIECRLTPLAREVLFNPEITEFVPSYDGRKKEPVTLPAKIPVLILQGAEGIAVGMATNILPHNFQEVLKAQIAILRDKPFQLLPDFPTGGLMDASGYEDGNGKIKVRARIEARDEKHVVVREVPFGTNTEKLIASIESAIKKNRIKVNAIQDYTAESVEIELSLPRGIYADQVIDALYAFTDCEMSHSPNAVVIGSDNKPQQVTISEILRYNTAKLVDDLRREYEIELGKLNDRLHFKTLEQIFIEKRIYKNIEEKETFDAVIAAVYKGFEPYTELLVRELVDEDVLRLLEIRIKRISRFDINKSRREIEEVKDRIESVEELLSDMKSTTIGYIKDLLKKYGKGRDRLTEISELETVDRREVAVQNLKLGLNEEKGFMGTEVKATGETIPCSKFDKVLYFTETHYKVVPVQAKLYIKEKILWWGLVDKETVFNVMYRYQESGIAYVKRFVVDKFIMEREYDFMPDRDECKLLFLGAGKAPTIRVYYPKTGRVRITNEDININEQLIKGVSARGNRVSSKPVTRFRVLKDPSRNKEEA